MIQTLSEQLNSVVELGFLSKDVPDHITDNLALHISLRPYQVAALERYLFYIEDYKIRPPRPHLLFHMATGSGKTVLMAALILDLYRRGYHNFLFFVNSTQIIQKTKENFISPASTKYLFAPQVRIDGKSVDIRTVETFDAVSDQAINIHFTTIQGLHKRIRDPRENAVTIEDFRDYKVVMISDEAHHLNAETKATPTKGEAEEKASWEGTVGEIFVQHCENMLLEFTATADLGHEAIRAKYHDKTLYDYSLRQFREDGYSKDIELRQADLSPVNRMRQAMVLSQYRRKVAEAHGIHCKPVILMKSKTIVDSGENEKVFTAMVEKMSGDAIQALRNVSVGDDTLSRAFAYIMDERGMSPESFALELQGDFGRDKVVNVNNPKDLEKRQIKLNSLEDRSNELRVIFAVDKLNEGWDVLNLFDIVRLYNTRDGRANKVGKTTMAEAQLIGRGARYFPFVDLHQPEGAKEKRKYDSALTHPLRVLEELHYHCSHNPKYIQDIRSALRETGMLDESAQMVEVRLKNSFKKSSLYTEGHVWVNERIKNKREGVHGLDAYKIEPRFSYPTLMTARVTESSVFRSGKSVAMQFDIDPISRELKLADFGKAILGFAMDANDFFHFASLRTYFPWITGRSQFLTSENYLGGVTVTVRGLPEDLDNLTARKKLEISHYVLRQIESGVKRESVEYVGTRDFKPHKISDRFVDKTLKLRIEGETGLSWTNSNVPGLDQINLTKKDWHAYDDNYGTDQEKHFIKYLNDQAEQLRSRYDDFFLLRNEKAVKLFAFENGQAFEPDFVLFLRKKGADVSTVLQLFIEPKGDHLKHADSWKEVFLKDIKRQGRIETFIQGRDYAVYGLPFFNESGQSSIDFKAAITGFLDGEDIIVAME